MSQLEQTKLRIINKIIDGQVCTDSSLVLIAESLIYILVHERCLADTAKGVEEYESGAAVAMEGHLRTTDDTHPLSPKMMTYWEYDGQESGKG
jgi:hypothetical protein